MKSCPQCNAPLKDDALFCSACGSKLEAEMSPAPWSAPESQQAQPQQPQPQPQAQAYQQPQQFQQAQPQQNDYMQGASWNAAPVKKAFPAKLVGIAAACVAVVGVGAAAAILLFGGSPKDRVEKSVRDAFDSKKGSPVENMLGGIIDVDETEKLLGFDVLNKIASSAYQIEINADVSELAGQTVVVEGRLQADDKNKRYLSDFMMDIAGQQYDASCFVDATELFLSVPMLMDRSLYLNLATFAEDWNDSLFGQQYRFSQDEIDSLQQMVELIQQGNTELNKQQQEEFNEIYNTFVDSFEYEELKDEELPSGNATLDCVEIVIPQDAIITFMEDLFDYSKDVMASALDTEALSSLMYASGSYSSYQNDFEDTIEQAKRDVVKAIEDVDLEVSIRTYYEKNASRCVAVEFTGEQYGDTFKGVAYLETEDVKNPLNNWEACLIAYTNGKKEGEFTVKGEYSYSKDSGHKHKIKFTDPYSGDQFKMDLSWNPEKEKNNLSFRMEMGSQGVFINGNYLVSKDSVTIGISEVGYEDSWSGEQSVRFDLEMVISAIDSVKEPGYTGDRIDVMKITESDLQEIIEDVMYNSELSSLLQAFTGGGSYYYDDWDDYALPGADYEDWF